jgi:cell division protein ZapA
MPQVSVTINGRQFRMACEDGEEGHLVELARELDAVADELVEAGLRIKRLEEELAALEDARVATSDRTRAAQTSIAAALSDAAERIEGITKKLNQTVSGSGIALG